jgi:hypothetical protein
MFTGDGDNRKFLYIDAIMLKGFRYRHNELITDDLGRILIRPVPLFHKVCNVGFRAIDFNYYMVYGELNAEGK